MCSNISCRFCDGNNGVLTSTTQVVENTFTVGNVEIALDEADVNEYGELLNKDGNVYSEGDELADRVNANSYKLMPGHSYVKDPTVTVKADSEESYIRMLVSINKISDVKEVLGDDFLPQNFVTGWDKDVWVPTEYITVSGEVATYEFRYFETVETVDAEEDLVLDALFETIEIPGTLTNEQIAKLADLEINVIAYAIQADGFENADEAWAAFEE